MSDWLKQAAIEIGGDLALRVAGVVAIVVGLLACAGLKHAWPDCPPSGYAVAMLGGVDLTMAAAFALCRATTGDVTLLLDIAPRQWRLLIGGLAVAMAFAVGLFAYEWHDKRVADAAYARGQAQQEQYHEQLRAIGRLPLPPRR